MSPSVGNKILITFFTINLNFHIISTLNLVNNKNSDNVVFNVGNYNKSDEISSLDENVSTNDQIRLLSKQMDALSTRRHEDYKLLENSLKNFVRKNVLQFTDTSVQDELDKLRQEIKSLRDGTLANKERITVEWLSKSIAELRNEIADLQESSNNISRDIQQKKQIYEDINEIKLETQSMRLELEELKTRQETTELLVKDARDRIDQKTENLQKSINIIFNERNEVDTSQEIEGGGHKSRHHRFRRNHFNDIITSHHAMKKQLIELQNQRVGDRLHSLETEQRRLASANFNVTRQIVNLDKLHSSMLELLEDVESVQNKVDRSIPEIKKEISKIDVNAFKVESEHKVLKEEVHNTALSMQAMAVTVNSLQDYKDLVNVQQKQIEQIKSEIEKIKSASTVHKENFHRRIEKIEKESKSMVNFTQPAAERAKLNDATQIVKELEEVEQQFESIVNKLPNDCSQTDFSMRRSTGLYLIAPAGQHHPILTRCDDEWTTIQRRYDGSVDFNQSWEIYSIGFGNPSGEFWIGNEMLHHLTRDNCTKLKITMQDIYDNVWLAEYNQFSVSSREDGFRINVSGYTGNASDALDYQNKMQFSSTDVDRDISNTNCAANYEGGWWFSHCQHANLNGRYNLGLTWFDASRNEWIAVKSSHMMVAPNNSCHKNINHNFFQSQSTPSTTTE